MVDGKAEQLLPARLFCSFLFGAFYLAGCQGGGGVLQRLWSGCVAPGRRITKAHPPEGPPHVPLTVVSIPVVLSFRAACHFTLGWPAS